MIVSHKPDHGFFGIRKGGRDNTSGQLHEDTAYGMIKGPEKEDGANLVYRKDFRNLNEKEIGRIRDCRLRDLVHAYVEHERQEGKDLKSALLSLPHATIFPIFPTASDMCG
jgi:CRISPR-associated endonuclease Csn1